MLIDLKISNYAIAQNLEIDFSKGLTTITGETGAGKSIMIDALALALGSRADSGVVSANAKRAEIVATFDISQNPAAQAWLTDKSLDCDDECILRRSISKDGKSKAFINGISSPLQDIKQLADMLIHIHSQHQHQALLKKDSHRGLLDVFCGHQKLLDDTKAKFKAWKDYEKQLASLSKSEENRAARIDFLSFQCEELDSLSIAEGESDTLNQEQKRLANTDRYMAHINTATQVLTDNDENSAVHLLGLAQNAITQISDDDAELNTALETLNSALIQIEELGADLNQYLNKLETDPGRLEEVDQRLAVIHQIARKHRIKPEEIHSFHQDLLKELNSLQNSDQTLEAISANLEIEKAAYMQLAEKLSKKRKTTAKKLDKAIGERFQELGMEHAVITTQILHLAADEAKVYGQDDIEMLIATNPGQAPQPLAKIASGGELSRISLAIQVNYAEKICSPCLIFDEVDVGIGGGTAEVVGKLLKSLSQHSQVLCVTHLPQVAAQGHQHLQVLKAGDKKVLETQVDSLNDKQKVVEIARMMGGVEVTKQSLSHAKEMLRLASG